MWYAFIALLYKRGQQNLYIPDDTLDRLILEDAPYLDLTTEAMGIGGDKVQ